MEFDLAMDAQGYIAQRVLPVLEIAKQSGSFGKITIESLLKDVETKRAPGAGYSQSHWVFEPVTYACEEHGLQEPIDDRQAEMYAEYFKAETIAAMRALYGVMRAAEKRAAALLFDAATWTGAALTTAITEEWDTPAAAIPITDVEAAVKKVYDGSGLWPNALIINKKVFRNLRNVAQIIDRIKYAGITDPRAGAITAAAMAQVFDLDYVIVAGGTKDSAKEGQTTTPAQIWSDEYAMVAKIATSDDIQEPCVGRTFHWAEDGSVIGGTVETYRDETKRSDIVRVRHDVDEVRLYVQAAHLLSNVTTI
jgi:hypothetical protein